MKLLSAEETLDLIRSNTIEEFMVKKDLLRRGPFNAHDSYDLILIFVAQRKDKLAWQLYHKKVFTINSWFYRQNKNDRGRQKYIEDGMKKFAKMYLPEGIEK